MKRGRRSLTRGLALVCAVAASGAAIHAGRSDARAAGGNGAASADPAEAAPPRLDYLTLAAGAIPVSVGGSGAHLGASFEKAIRAVDGDPAGFGLLLKPGPADTDTEFVYELPAPTVFDRFAVPNVLETPSPSITFTRRIEILGSAESADAGFTTLASATLTTHRSRGEVTEIPPSAQPVVRWVKVRLAGGIDVTRPEAFFEFSELVGNGRQEAADTSRRFTGAWKGRGVQVRLTQEGPVVTGCYDHDGELTGTVTGNILHALGTERATGVPSAFILGVRGDGTLFGVRSANGAPFALYTGAPSTAASAPSCPAKPEPLGCGSVIHGIGFDFDSAVIRPGASDVLAKLHDGLKDDPASAIVIEGHTSSEGTDRYNEELSGRRAQAVRDELVRRGIVASRISAAGVGEKRPISSNADENGRSINRRVEVHCR